MKVLVTVLPKEEVSDPQGEAILAAARTLGFSEVTSVRAGRSFIVEVGSDTVEQARLEARLRALGDELLANPIVETFTITRL